MKANKKIFVEFEKLDLNIFPKSIVEIGGNKQFF